MTTQVRCPNCRQLVRWQGNPYRPFCSERCRMVDLGHWASERYRIAGEEAQPEDDVPNGVESSDGTDEHW